MTISDSTTTFHGKKVVQYDADIAFDPSPSEIGRAHV